MSYKIGGAQNNSAPFDRNLDLLEVFSWKTMFLFSPILLLIGPILLLVGGAQGTPWALSSLRLCSSALLSKKGVGREGSIESQQKSDFFLF